MNQGRTNQGPITSGKPNPRVARTPDQPLGIDDIGLPADTRADDARSPAEIKPDPARPVAGKDTGATREADRSHADQTEPASEKEYANPLERLASKIDPPGREVKDDDIFDPGRMTPGAPPVDNRS